MKDQTIYDKEPEEFSEPQNQLYIGCKIIKGIPMSKHAFNQFKGIEYDGSEDMEGVQVEYPDGYISWSPKSVFEKAYRKVSASELNFITQ